MGKYRHESIVTDGTDKSPYPDAGPGMRICLYRSLEAFRRRYFPIPGPLGKYLHESVLTEGTDISAFPGPSQGRGNISMDAS